MQATLRVTMLKHDCTSLGGNSGSPLIRLSDGKVVGLHFAGVYGVENSAVGVGTLRAARRRERRSRSLVLEADGASGGAADGRHPRRGLLRRPRGYDPSFLAAASTAPWPGLPGGRRSGPGEPSDGDGEQPTSSATRTSASSTRSPRDDSR